MTAPTLPEPRPDDEGRETDIKHCPKCGWRLSGAPMLPEGWYCPNPNCPVGPTRGAAHD